MTQTVHGHHIPRTGRNDEDKKRVPKACGGIDICGICKMQTKALYMKKYPEDFQPEI